MQEERRHLFDRPPPPGYAEEWGERLREKPDEAERDTQSFLIFRLRGEWLAVPTPAVREVMGVEPAHRIPHRNHEIIRGLVNVRGELTLCFSLARLLNLDDDRDAQALSRRVYPRMIVLAQEEETFAFRADEIFDVQPIETAALRPVPDSLRQALHRFTQNLFHFRERQVGLIDTALIFHALNHHHL